jgi:hypothetical protein
MLSMVIVTRVLVAVVNVEHLAEKFKDSLIVLKLFLIHDGVMVFKESNS